MNSSSHIKTQKLTGENWVKGRETIQFYKSGMNQFEYFRNHKIFALH